MQHDFLHRGKHMKRWEFGLTVSYTPKFARSNLINPIMRMEDREVLDLTAVLKSDYRGKEIFEINIGYKYKPYTKG